MSAGIRRRRIRLIHAALTCMGLLVVSRPKFNFRSNILSLLIARLADDDMQTRAIILKQIDSILFDDHVSEIAVEIVRSVSKLVKNKKYLVPPDVLNCLLGIPLKADLKDKKIQMQARKRARRNAN